MTTELVAALGELNEHMPLITDLTADLDDAQLSRAVYEITQAIARAGSRAYALDRRVGDTEGVAA